MRNQINADDQNTHQTEQNPAVQPEQIPEKPKINYLVIAAVILTGFLIFSFGGYYFGKQSSSWKTYTNIALGFSFKYPPDWDALNRGDAGVIIGPKKIIAEVKKITGPTEGPNLISVYVKPPATFYMAPPQTDKFISVSPSTILVDGQSATRYEQKALQDGQATRKGDVTIRILMDYKGKTYDFYSPARYRPIFDQVLSTFKFIDSQSALQTSTTAPATTNEQPTAIILIAGKTQISETFDRIISTIKFTN